MVRVDGRLIHGQVTTGFTRRTGANLILVANDEVAQDKNQQNIMKLAAPSGVKIEILPLQEALQGLAKRRWPNAKILLLLRSPVDLLRLTEMGLTVQKVNVGGVNNEGATIKITNEVYATPKELEAWKKLDEMGVDLSVQWEISVSPTDLNKALRKHT
ncbi:MAG: PTS system mannose/fructose/N-acetylgalactosamine-transporter subunit IIB [Chloroflexota bacterium]